MSNKKEEYAHEWADLVSLLTSALNNKKDLDPLEVNRLATALVIQTPEDWAMTFVQCLSRFEVFSRDGVLQSFGIMNIPQVPAKLMGQLILEALPDAEEQRMSTESKAYWLQVAEVLGPDWIPQLKKAADFMKRVDEFV